MRDLILQLSKSSIYSTKPFYPCINVLICLKIIIVLQNVFYTRLLFSPISYLMFKPTCSNHALVLLTPALTKQDQQ
ncbi:hypothetical protein EQH49_16970 [Klebsiella pneumoniae]|nr:hypothetical protein EQH49_16970 [Klebsiella pneumoniae]